MERFCNKCGSLVSGDGIFCPNCGEQLDSAVDLSKPQAQDGMPTGATGATGSTGSSDSNSSGEYGLARSTGTYGTANTTAANSANTTGNTGGYQGQMPTYSQPIQPANTQQEMTVGQWVLTIFLSGLGIIGIILLFVWGFSNDTPTSKRNYARAMLIWEAIAVGLLVIIYIGLFACIGIAAGGLGEFFESIDNMSYSAAINNFFIR